MRNWSSMTRIELASPQKANENSKRTLASPQDGSPGIKLSEQ